MSPGSPGLRGRGSKPRETEQRKITASKLRLEIHMLCRLHNIMAECGRPPEVLARHRAEAETRLEQLRRLDPESEDAIAIFAEAWDDA